MTHVSFVKNVKCTYRVQYKTKRYSQVPIWHILYSTKAASWVRHVDFIGQPFFTVLRFDYTLYAVIDNLHITLITFNSSLDRHSRQYNIK